MREKILGFDYKSLKENYVSRNTMDNENFLKEILSKSNDLRFKRLGYGSSNKEILIVYVETIIESKIIEEYVIKPLTLSTDKEDISIISLKNDAFKVLKMDESNSFDELVLKLLSGYTLLFLEGSTTALAIGSKSDKGRAITTPESEQNVRGSRVGLTENIKTNIALIRNQIKDPNLCIEIVKVGKRTIRDIAIVYINGIVDDKIPNGIKDKIQKIDVDGITGGAGELEQFIQKHKYVLLPQMLATERLDRVIGNLFEGRVVLILDGTPFVLVNPTTFNLLLSSSDEYYQTPLIGTLLRLVRYMSYVLATSLEAVYLALTSYHPGMIPTPLVLSITGSRLGLPFPVLLEVVIMELTLYVLQEAAIRLPKPMGTTVGVVGGLVIGQSVVEAGVVSPIIVIIVSGSAITSFAMPNYTFSLGCILIRILLVTSTAVLGLYGLVMGWIFVIIYLSSLENFGVRYLSDFSPYSLTNLKDGFIKLNSKNIFRRPSALKVKDDIRNNTNIEVDDNNDTW